MADFVDQKRGEMEARLKELRPLVEEYDRLTAAVAALSAVGAGTPRKSAGSSRTAAKPARQRGSGSGRRGRPKGSGTRDKEALTLVKAQPGVTIPEIAKEMGIKQNYLYRVLPSLEKDGLVSKKGRGWYPR
ncbi:MAG: hypothetical protein F2813_07565 [Actinobacteria bacterium]|uniref:Unannotated protein n=1 Tax=freshwater metagenome TaxID=449393 RepID=A0A6J5ZWT1_9ZZZZ|nr:hypothetical protein [Actinomycetota bacterium]